MNMGLKILSCGAGMQSTALALMSCENELRGVQHPLVPRYNAVIFCDLGHEPVWVYEQVQFIEDACETAGLRFVRLPVDLYGDYMENFGKRRVSSIPFWTTSPTGRKGKMLRQCTIDYKITEIQRFVKFNMLGYDYAKRNRPNRPEDIDAHEMHIGYSAEEKSRVFENKHPFFVNKYPLIDMGLERPDNYKYILERWGLETKASACAVCPFHRNYFFQYIRENDPQTYDAVLKLDQRLEEEQPNTAIESQLFISRSRKRIRDLRPEDCMDAETFDYCGKQVWNGF